VWKERRLGVFRVVLEVLHGASEVLSIMFRALDLNGRPVDMDEVTRRPRADLGILSPRMSADEHGRPQKATV
jgi:hypothetical protein